MHNMQQMMGQVKKMQKEMKEQMESLRVEASSGGGIVTVSMNGTKHLLSVKIDPEAVKGGDVEMLEDLLQAAVNEAVRKADQALAEKLGGLAGGMNLPGIF
ncbi:MAG: YbaB/EbfC family nucleoid-associated protein [Acidobacteria bacterium]|nr:YbaB/EbfC family nucleoid-associated protein [Acidobacteriota bacterium]MCZ6753213.1 YbaB/EbfC family nucleoid-associated protein [Acidobacteriota bacterium]